MALTPVSPLDRTSTTFRSDCDTFFGSTFPQFVGEANALAANLNSIAAGGAYAIPYVYSGAVGTGVGGKMVMNNATASAATALVIDTRDVLSNHIDAQLATFNGSTSAVRGTIRLVKQNDASVWALFAVTSYSADSLGYYGTAFVQYIGSSSANPFVSGDAVLLFFQRTGDKGDQGPAGTASVQLLASATVSSAVANIDFLNTFTSAYDTYAVEIQGALVSSAASMNVWLAKAGAVDTSAVYYSPVGDGATGTASQTVFAYSGITIPSAGPNSLTATMRFRNANSATGNKTVSLQGLSNGAATIKEAGYLGLNTVTGFRLSPTNASNFTGGTIRVYGIKNS